MMHGYASLMGQFNSAIADKGVVQVSNEWTAKLSRLAKEKKYTMDPWSGDLFEKRNPLWQRVGVVKPGKDGKKLTVLNTGAARSECGRVLRQLLSMDTEVSSLGFLANR
jgi:hypothetical protein